jgi:hypothetical protein
VDTLKPADKDWPLWWRRRQPKTHGLFTDSDQRHFSNYFPHTTSHRNQAPKVFTAVKVHRQPVSDKNPKSQSIGTIVSVHQLLLCLLERRP